MAGTTAPLFGLDARGSLGKAIVFSKWKGRTYVRKHSIPANPQSGLQTGMRASMKFITQSWAGMSQADKDAWHEIAAVTNITDLNAMVGYNQALVRRNLGIQLTPAETPGTTPTAPQTPSATAQPKTVVVAWTQPVTPGDYATYIYGSSVTGFTPDISNLVAIVAHGVLSFTDIGLTTGVARYYRGRQSNTNGEFGALFTEVTATPT